MIVTRLEEEVAEAQARLDRTLAKFRSPEHPAVVRASETLEALVQRLDRIDRVLVDVVETYPTMVDFSGDPPNVDQNAQPAGGHLRDNANASSFPRGQMLGQNGATGATDQQNWSNAKHGNEYSASKQPDNGKPGQNNFEQQGVNQKDKAQQTSPRDQPSGAAQKDGEKPGQNSQGQKAGSQNKDGSQSFDRGPVQNNDEQKNGSQTLDRGTEQNARGRKDGSEESGAAEHMLEIMSGTDAEKTYFQGTYYKKTNKAASAEYYFGKVMRRWPDSPWAAKAKAELGEMSAGGIGTGKREGDAQQQPGAPYDHSGQIERILGAEIDSQPQNASSQKDCPILQGQSSQGKSKNADTDKSKP